MRKNKIENGKKYWLWNCWRSHLSLKGMKHDGIRSSKLFAINVFKESIGEHIEYDENQTENHEFFRMMFMMSPGIVLFCALFHLAFDWVGFIRVMIRKCLFYGDRLKSSSSRHIEISQKLHLRPKSFRFNQSKPCQVGPEVHKKDERELYLLNGLYITRKKTKESIKMLIQTIQFIFIYIF